jgi:hypothetical protein
MPASSPTSHLESLPIWAFDWVTISDMKAFSDVHSFPTLLIVPLHASVLSVSYALTLASIGV